MSDTLTRTTHAPVPRPTWNAVTTLRDDTKAEYFYDYAGQDPINSYDLDGTKVGGPPGPMWPRNVIFSGYCTGPCWGLDADPEAWTNRQAAWDTALFVGVPAIGKAVDYAPGSETATRVAVSVKERGEIASAANEATPPNFSTTAQIAHVAGHVVYPDVKNAVVKKAPKIGRVAIRRAKAGAAIGLRQLGGK